MPSQTAGVSEAELLESLDPARIPRHVAIIMDGNGRWAKARGLPRAAGHRAGVEGVRAAVRACDRLKVEALTLYSFSTENWLRPKQEVSELMRLMAWGLRHEVGSLHKNNVRIMTSGRIAELPKYLREELKRAVERLKGNTGLLLNFAVNYGSRAEIIDAVNGMIRDGVREATEEELSRRLYTAGLPDPDLVIRTSGELRLSNFLLWQAAYAEFYVTPLFWPDFRERHLYEAVADYQRRKRRFGGI